MSTMSENPSHRDENSDIVDIAVTAEREFERDEIVALYDSVGWTSYTADVDALMRGLGGVSAVWRE